MTATIANLNVTKIMKTTQQPCLIIAILLTVVLGAVHLGAEEIRAPARQMGIYDSRAVAYAWFWSDPHQRQLKELGQSARMARVAGQTNHWQELEAALRRQQDDVHRQVFSTAPANDALTAIQQRIPEIEKQADVFVLVSQWDDQSLRQYPDAGKVDVTDRLVREFKPSEGQLKVIAELKKQKPLPLPQCDELIRQGRI